MKVSLKLNLENAPLLTYRPFQSACLGDINGTSFMCPTSITTYSDHSKSIMKFGIKRSHEMISYMIVGMTLLSKWNHEPSTNLCNLTQMTLHELYNKSHEGFMLSLCPENASISLKP